MISKMIGQKQYQSKQEFKQFEDHLLPSPLPSSLLISGGEFNANWFSCIQLEFSADLIKPGKGADKRKNTEGEVREKRKNIKTKIGGVDLRPTSKKKNQTPPTEH